MKNKSIQIKFKKKITSVISKTVKRVEILSPVKKLIMQIQNQYLH